MAGAKEATAALAVAIDDSTEKRVAVVARHSVAKHAVLIEKSESQVVSKEEEARPLASFVGDGMAGTTCLEG